MKKFSVLLFILIQFYLFSSLYGQSASNFGDEKKFSNEVVEIILKYNTEPDLVIFNAAFVGDYDSVIKLLDHGFAYTTSKIEQKNGVRNWNITDSACRGGNIDFIDYLIEDRKILPTRDHFSDHIKRHNPNYKLIDFLLSKGYKLPPKIIFDAFHESQYSTEEITKKAEYIYYSKKLIKTPKIELVKFLIDRGGRVGSPNHHQTSSKSEIVGAIWFALLHNMYLSEEPIRTEFMDMIRLLLEAGLNPDANSCHWIPYTAFYREACSEGYLAPGGYICHCRYNYSYTTPMGVAVSFRDLELVKLLLYFGANPKGTTGYYRWSGNGYGGNDSPRWVHAGNISLLDLCKNDKEIKKLLLEYWD